VMGEPPSSVGGVQVRRTDVSVISLKSGTPGGPGLSEIGQ
jgi:hypothetical protein